MNVFDLRFTGGEPTFRDDWFQILSRAKALGFALSLNTNGVYPQGSAIIDRLLSLELNQLTVSIDGLAETHDRIRGSGSFDSSMASIERLYRGGAPLRTNTVLTRDNVTEVPQLISLLSPMVREMNFFYMRPVGRAVKLRHQHLDFDQHFRSSQETIALRAGYPNVRIMHFEQSFIERSIIKEELPFADLAMAPPYGSTTLGLNADGSMWPHGYTPYQASPLFKLGQYPHVNLAWVWHDSPVLDAIRGWLRKLMERCKTCSEYRSRCAGLNFEMEVARSVGHITANPYCISDAPVPQFNSPTSAAWSPKRSTEKALHHIKAVNPIH
jgi:MoaA/NifB/PqqE/SkfB family radical SAM enzyme